MLLQQLRHLIGTKRAIPDRLAKIRELKAMIGNPVAVDLVERSTAPESFSSRGEKIVRQRLQRLQKYNATAARKPPIAMLQKIALQSIDLATERHITDVVKIAEAIFENLPPAQKQALNMNRKMASAAAALHDFGKLLVPSAVLRKTAPLTEKDWALIKQHPLFSEILLTLFGFSAETANAAKQHHLSYDLQSGYPAGFFSKLSEVSRLVAVADAIEAMTAGRFNRQPKSMVGAMKQLHAGEGTQFDPKYAEALIVAFRKDSSFRQWWKARREQYRLRRSSEPRALERKRLPNTRRVLDDRQ